MDAFPHLTVSATRNLPSKGFRTFEFQMRIKSVLKRYSLCIRFRFAVIFQNSPHTYPQLIFNFKIPEPQHLPTFGEVVLIDFPIPLHVAFDLGDPKALVGMDVFFAGFPVMSMPKGAINKNNQFVFDEDYVRLTWKFSPVAPVA